MVIKNMLHELNVIYDRKVQIEECIKKGGNTLDQQQILLEEYRSLQEKEIEIKKRFTSYRSVKHLTL